MVAQSKLTSLLNEEILSLRNNLTKDNVKYWNHFMFILDKCNSVPKYVFSYFPELDKQKEKETRETIGDELYEKFEEERRNFKEPEEETVNMHSEDMTIGQLLGFIKDGLLENLPHNWESIIMDTRTTNAGEHHSIDTSFYFQSIKDKKAEFDPENPIPPMNALLRIKDKMADNGNNWNTSTIIIYKNGEVEIKTE